MNYPAGVAVDKSGNLYIADTGNHRILRVDTSGTITTIAGTGEPGYGGDGGPASEAQLASPIAVAVDSSGKLYIADLGNYRIRILTPPPRLDFAHFANGGFHHLRLGVGERGDHADPSHHLLLRSGRPPH